MSGSRRNRLYVGNLAPTVAAEELVRLFGAHGPVEKVEIIVDTPDGAAEGFAFVEMEIASDAQAAIRALNGSKLRGHSLVVKDALAG